MNQVVLGQRCRNIWDRANLVPQNNYERLKSLQEFRRFLES